MRFSFDCTNNRNERNPQLLTKPLQTGIPLQDQSYFYRSDVYTTGTTFITADAIVENFHLTRKFSHTYLQIKRKIWQKNKPSGKREISKNALLGLYTRVTTSSSTTCTYNYFLAS